MKEKKKYIFSGIGVSSLGTGRFVGYLKKISGRKWIIKWQYIDEIKNAKHNNNYYSLLCFAILQLYSYIRFNLYSIIVRNSDIILLHPQTIGLNNTICLIKNNNVKYYVLDNSYFCLKSYNYRSDIGECLDCLSRIGNYHATCKSFPIKVKNYDFVLFHKYLIEYSKRIEFLTQNASQSILLKKHFGNEINVVEVGMITPEIDYSKLANHGNNTWNNVKMSNTIVYHATNLEEKGINYTLELSKYLPNYTFIIPFSRDEINSIEKLQLKENVLFHKCNWENGLMEIVENCQFTICPSMWSAPVEGAVLKSIMHGNIVCVVQTDYGFVNDIPDDVVLKLSNEIQNAVKQIKYCNFDINAENKLKWLSQYYKKSEINIQNTFI
jgi:hypothetical protein